MNDWFQTASIERGPRWAVGGVVTLFGMFMLVGGTWLAALGGSWYFLLAGLGLLLAGLLMIGGRPIGAWLYALIMAATVLWAYADVGAAFWPLMSRLFAFGVLSLLVVLVYPGLMLASGRPAGGRSVIALALLIVVGLVAAILRAFQPTPIVRAAQPPLPVVPVTVDKAQKDWRHWANTTAGTHFAALDQINLDNVGQLEVAWISRTGEFAQSLDAAAQDQNTPLQIGTTLYVCTAFGKVLALDADTGTERWHFDPQASSPSWQRCRGLGFHDSEDTGTATPACRKRIFLPTIDARLIALDADTGKPCADFGSKGTVDLTANMGEVKPGEYQQTSAPLIAGDLVVVGGRVADDLSVDEPPGVVRAFDVRSGALVWAWDPGNPDATGSLPPGVSYTRGTPNVWAAMAYDAGLGLIYLPTGNATPDFWAGSRTELDDKFGSALVAIEAQTGRVRWIFQTTHHDLWNFDLAAQPLLFDLPNGDADPLPALVEVTKQGEIFLLNRQTGMPIAPVEERTVPRGSVPGERYSPTQPFSVGMPSIGNAVLTESDSWGATPLDQLLCRIQFRRMRYQGAYTPPGLDPSLQYPGSLGGMNWGGVSVDPTINYMFVNDIRLGLASLLVPHADMRANGTASAAATAAATADTTADTSANPEPEATAKAGTGTGTGTDTDTEKTDAQADLSAIESGILPQRGTPFGAVRQHFLSALGIPCQKPPYGTLSAIDLNTRKLAWQVPIGTLQDTGPRGVKMNLKIPIGLPTLGPSLATQSGLVFFAGTQDYYLRAFDSRSGKQVWKGRLPVGSQSGPMTYVSPKTHRQYVVVTAGGAPGSPDRGDYVIAYALP